MPRYICHLDGKFFEWSTVVEAPVTIAVTRDQFTEYYQQEYGRANMGDLPDRMDRAEKTSCSSRIGDTVTELVETAILNGTINSWEHFHSMLDGSDEEAAREISDGSNADGSLTQ